MVYVFLGIPTAPDVFSKTLQVQDTRVHLTRGMRTQTFRQLRDEPELLRLAEGFHFLQYVLVQG